LAAGPQWDHAVMQNSLVTIIAAVSVLAAVVAVFTSVASGRVYRDVGRGGLDTTDGERSSASPADEREQEIRQMLAARDARRDRRGEQPLDLDAEFAALLRAEAADGLRGEVRALVEARNRRRERNGLAPLDVAAEIERQLHELN
jgi:Spy/CpxP family protein refolding chaperone